MQQAHRELVARKQVKQFVEEHGLVTSPCYEDQVLAVLEYAEALSDALDHWNGGKRRQNLVAKHA